MIWARWDNLILEVGSCFLDKMDKLMSSIFMIHFLRRKKNAYLHFVSL